VTVQQIEQALYDAYGSRQVSTIYTPNNQYWVILELLPEYQRDPSALQLLYLRSQTGKLIPLTSVASASNDVGPLSVTTAAAAVGHPLVQPASRCVPRPAVTTYKAPARPCPPDQHRFSRAPREAFQASQQGLVFLYCSPSS